MTCKLRELFGRTDAVSRCNGMHPSHSAMAADMLALAGTLAFQQDALTFGALRACHCCLPFYTWVLSRHSVRPGVQHTGPTPLFSAVRRARLSAWRVLSGNIPTHRKFICQTHSSVQIGRPAGATAKYCAEVLHSVQRQGRLSAYIHPQPHPSHQAHSPACRPSSHQRRAEKNRCLPHRQKDTPSQTTPCCMSRPLHPSEAVRVNVSAIAALAGSLSTRPFAVWPLLCPAQTCAPQARHRRQQYTHQAYLMSPAPRH